MRRAALPLKRPPRAVLFDMDGVIVDSMPYHYIAWYEALRSVGIRVSLEDVFLKEGERWDKTLTTLVRRHGRKPKPPDVRRLFKLRQAAFTRVFKRFLFPGCVDLLLSLHARGYKLGIVTGTPSSDLESIVPRRIRRLFDTMVTGNMVKRGKPSPEPYLTAAHLLGLAPRECLVVENAPLGVASAKRAGMPCIAIATSLPGSFLRQADRVVNRFEEIAPLVDASFRRMRQSPR